MSEILALGISHKTAPVAVRERLAFTDRQALQFAQEALRNAEIDEAVVICTCNRTEVYLVVGDPVQAEAELLRMLSERAGMRPTQLAEVIYSPRNCDAARHLYRVASGLESMVLGEAEIQGQVRRAHEMAMQAGCTGPLSNRLFAAALSTGKRVRSETGIGQSRLSISSVAVDLASRLLGSLTDRHVVIVGAGETSELTASALSARGAGTVFVANRHAKRALSIAERFGGSVVSLDELPEQMTAADIVVSSTSSPHQIIDDDDLALVMEMREGRPLLLIDIAVPRDIDPACNELEGVTLYDIDDLQAIVSRNVDARAELMPQAEQIIEEEISRFARWLGQSEALPTVSALRAHADALVRDVLSDNDGHWESASAADLSRVEAIANAVASRLLHEPTVRLRSLPEQRRHASLELVRELFGLSDERNLTRRRSRRRSSAGEQPDERLAEVRQLRARHDRR